MSDTNKSISKPVILPYQQSIFNRLCAIARSCLYIDRTTIQCIKLRANFLLIGPSGTGKTFLAEALSKEIGVPFISVSISDWLLLGSSNRGGSCTWPVIFDFLEKNKKSQGAIIFIDEIDKASHDSNWNAFLRAEVFSLCDYRLPVGLNDTDGDMIDAHKIKEVESFLRYKTMIVAGAAFQSIWENRSTPTMGFNPATITEDPPELSDLTKFLPRELINRFSSEIFVLPQPTKLDYKIMIETMAENISTTWKSKFLELGLSRLDQAVRHQKGARYAEEILLAAIVEERSCMENWKPETTNQEASSNDPVKPDTNIAIF